MAQITTGNWIKPSSLQLSNCYKGSESSFLPHPRRLAPSVCPLISTLFSNKQHCSTTTVKSLIEDEKEGEGWHGTGPAFWIKVFCIHTNKPSSHPLSFFCALKFFLPHPSRPATTQLAFGRALSCLVSLCPSQRTAQEICSAFLHLFISRPGNSQDIPSRAAASLVGLENSINLISNGWYIFETGNSSLDILMSQSMASLPPPPLKSC